MAIVVKSLGQFWFVSMCQLWMKPSTGICCQSKVDLSLVHKAFAEGPVMWSHGDNRHCCSASFFPAVFGRDTAVGGGTPEINVLIGDEDHGIRKYSVERRCPNLRNGTKKRQPPELTSCPAVNSGLSRRQAGAEPAGGPASSTRVHGPARMCSPGATIG